MALNKLKKWIGTQLWSTFMTEYNDNVDATNAAIDLVESHMAESAPVKLDLQNGWTGNLYAQDLKHGQIALHADLVAGSASSGTIVAQLQNQTNYIPIASHAFNFYNASLGRTYPGFLVTRSGNVIFRPGPEVVLDIGAVVHFNTMFAK